MKSVLARYKFPVKIKGSYELPAIEFIRIVNPPKALRIYTHINPTQRAGICCILRYDTFVRIRYFHCSPLTSLWCIISVDGCQSAISTDKENQQGQKPIKDCSKDLTPKVGQLTYLMTVSGFWKSGYMFIPKAATHFLLQLVGWVPEMGQCGYHSHFGRALNGPLV